MALLEADVANVVVLDGDLALADRTLGHAVHDLEGGSPAPHARAADEGGGNNVVNVILTDTRALDTLGEVIVLMTVAVGILTLARKRRTSSSGCWTGTIRARRRR